MTETVSGQLPDTGLRAEVERWVRSNLPDTGAPAEPSAGWLAVLGERGYTVPHWPVEHGGLGYTEEQAAPCWPLTGPGCRIATSSRSP